MELDMSNLVVYKGDDTAGNFGRHLQFTINVEEGVSLTGCVAQFSVHGITKSWANITPGQQVEIVFTHDETSRMPPGPAYGVFRIIDADNNIRTFDDAVPFCVTTDIRQVYPGSSSATVLIGTLVKWGDVSGRPEHIVQSVNATLPDENGNVEVQFEFKPLTDADVFNMECSDWQFRKCLARVWESLGGKVINND